MVTTTDYMPTHNEEAVIAQVTGRTVVLKNPLQWQHNASQFMLPANTPSSIGPRGSGSVDTRAAVGLLTRSIEVLSEGNTPDTDPSEHDHFPPTPGNYFGGHTIVRQGFTNYQIKGVEFYRLGQGGLIGHYAVHFHMARKTPQPVDPTQAPYFKDSSIHESMTRWITVHATQGMTFARNVGFQSIGHGFYLEDATEVNNKLYANLGASVIPGVQNAILNPRNVPGILARPNDGPTGSFMPYRSDWNHPTTFWMMNGWNDFQYNMAAGVTACGACYWLLPGANGGPSMFETWDGYASEQLDVLEASPLRMNNLGRAGLTPLKSFIGNSCVAAANSFISIGEINDCIGFTDGSWVDTTLQAVPNPLAPPLPPNQPTAAFLLYYPQLTGLRTPTLCPGADDPNQSVDCSNGASPPLNPCSGGTPSDTSTCAVTVLDHYTTSFNYAQTNFTAIWMRPKWFLVTDSAITDIQYGGLNFVTGGGYTRSDSPVGNWMVAYRNVFIGTSQPVDANGMPANGYASNAGPFNPTSGLTCDNKDFDFCLSSNNGISMQLTPFPGERLFSIYDGPVYQDSNAYLDVYPTIMSGSGWMYKDRVQGVPMDANGECYLPNAAIAWKQPNGFFYPPAFHSENLMFLDANIRHFVIEPLLLPGTFQTDVNAVKKRYCSGNWNPALFEGFTDIDRQTVLNDGVPDLPGIPGGSGSLTGKVGTEVSPDPTQGRETISVNLDDFFNAPVEVPECGSDMHKSALNGQGLPATAKVSPYEYVTTGMIAKCAIGFNGPNPNECVQPDGTIRWSQPCGNEFCFGVPLYRQLLTDTEWTENPKPEPFVKMMGQGTGQRSTLTLNHGHYYVDTTNNCAHQTPPLWNGSCPLQDNYQTRKYNVSVFLPNTTYYLYFLYAKASTQLTYDIYVGTNASEAPTVTGVRGVFPDANYVFTDVASAPWLGDSYNKDTGLLTVTVDLSKSAIAQEMASNFPDFCQPQSYCAIKPSRIGGVPVCGCKSGTDCKDDSVCGWGPKDIDCPEEGCYGFSFTMPSSFQVPFEPLPPPAAAQFSSETWLVSVGPVVRLVPVVPVPPVGGPVRSVAPVVTVHPFLSPLVQSTTTTTNGVIIGESDGEEFTIVSGNSAVSVSSNGLSISTEDNSAAANSLRRNFSGDFIWFIRDGKAYIIRDPATIKQAMDFFAPARELGRQQEELGKQQEALGAQQEALGAKQEALGEQMEKVRIKIPDMTAELQKLEAELKKMSEGGTQEDLGRLQEKIGEIQNRIGELQEKAGEQQSELGEKQGALGEEQGKLGEQQGKLGEQQGKLGEQQEAASRNATREMKKLLDEAVASGLAKPA